jgi:predicted  nucleic acid-binding Zn-ribbon protein
MERVGEMTKQEMKQLLSAIKDGSAAKKLQEEVNDLKAKNETLSKKLRNMKKEMKNIRNEKYY